MMTSLSLRATKLALCVTAALLMVACAHPISIEARTLPEKSTTATKTSVAYVMTDADRKKMVITDGGGGDKISYFPYKDFERSLRASLASVYGDVSVIDSASNAAAIRDARATLVFMPEIATTSSSPSLFTWPPTKFSVTVTVDVLDAYTKPVARLRVTGNGEAEWSEFKGEFGLAGRRAVEDAALALAAEIRRTQALQ